MINSNILQGAKSWPFEEARKILKKINNQTPKKGYVLFETGYGPSGLPHIGTFGEVVRTCFVKHAFELLAPEIPTRLFCVSDDIDGLRKVPDNVPNKEMVAANLGKPLTKVPDPFGTHNSFGEHMNERLKGFLDSFGFEYEFVSASEKYNDGSFNDSLLGVLQNYEKIQAIMLPSLREERRKTYCPFMPIDAKTGKVLSVGVEEINKEKQTITYRDEDDELVEISPLDGNCKLQWKVDFGARWANLDVDFEIYGKEHFANEKIYRSICKALGGKAPVNYFYELFLDQKGQKISKSSGNGISVEDWLKYAPKESIILYMLQKPRTAKRLYFDVIPKAMDEYLAFLNNFYSQDEQKQIENPVFFVHFGDVPENNFNLSYSLLLNLASACNPENEDVLWGFVEKYQSGLNKENSPLLAKMIVCALNYYNDFIKVAKSFKKADDTEKKALIRLKEILLSLPEDSNEGDIQTAIFSVGKEFDYQNLRDWFKALYQILLGQEQGPRMGSFVALFGIGNFVKLIDQKIA